MATVVCSSSRTHWTLMAGATLYCTWDSAGGMCSPESCLESSVMKSQYKYKYVALKRDVTITCNHCRGQRNSFLFGCRANHMVGIHGEETLLWGGCGESQDLDLSLGSLCKAKKSSGARSVRDLKQADSSLQPSATSSMCNQLLQAILIWIDTQYFLLSFPFLLDWRVHHSFPLHTLLHFC